MVIDFFRRIMRKYPLLRLWWMRFKKISFPGFEGVPIYDVIIKFRQEIQNDAITIRASAICYTFLLALLPTSIFFFTLIPYLPFANFHTTLFEFLADALPLQIFLAITPTLEDILNKPNGGLLSFNFVLATYFSTAGVMAMMKAFDKANDTFGKRSTIRKFFAALRINFLIIFQIIVIVVFLILSKEQIKIILNWIGIKSELNSVLLHFIRYALAIASLFNTIAMIYYYAPAVKKKYRYFSIGATFATLLGILASAGFTIYINFVYDQLNSLYGSLSLMILFLVYLYVNALVLLFGFELNNSIAVNKSLISDQIEK